MPLAGMVLNRVHGTYAPGLGRERAVAAAEQLEEHGDPTTAGVLRLHAERVAIADRERRLRDTFTSTHRAVAMAEAGALATDVHDLAGLRAVGRDLGDPGDLGAAS
jgi:hypothetical protein